MEIDQRRSIERLGFIQAARQHEFNSDPLVMVVVVLLVLVVV